MSDAPDLIDPNFPKASKYHPDWILASASGGANSLWLTEWLARDLDLKPGMRVLDLGCGRAASSIFLHREFEVQVWAVDLWFSPSENLQRVNDAGAGQGVFPLRAEAGSLPFPSGFFDVIVCVDSFSYFGTDDTAITKLSRFLKPGGQIGIVGAGLMKEIENDVPSHLKTWWEPELWSLHSPGWWKRHWERTGCVDVETADTMEEGWRLWKQWHEIIAPDNRVEIQAVQEDAGRFLGYVRVIGRTNEDVRMEDPMVNIPSDYEQKPLLRTDD